MPRYWARRSVVQISPAASFRLSTGEQQTSHCDLTNSELGDLDIRGVDLQGVKLDNHQASLLMERLGIAVIG